MDLFEHASKRDYPDGVPHDVCDLFERITLDLHRRGWPRFSSDAVLHRIRWEMQIERDNRAFKCNNNWTAPLARWFLARHPECAGFFELRERIDDGYSESHAA